MDEVAERLDELAVQRDFSGAVRVERNGQLVAEFARGFRDRANEVANTIETRFAVASGTKGLTALATVSLVESGDLSFDTTVRSIVGDDLPLVDAAVTIEHLLTHRSGVGDYIDETADGHIDDYLMGSQSPHTFDLPAKYLDLLNDHDQKSAPGARFAYNNSGYVMLSLVIEHVTGSFHRTVTDRILKPAGMLRSGFFRSDSLPSNTAIGYLEDGRSNVFHLPVIGAGDGGIYLTLADATALWQAVLGRQIVSSEHVELMTSVVSDHDDQSSYGRGFWLDRTGDHVWLEGIDAGVSFLSGVRRSDELRYTVMSNTSDGVWPLGKAILNP